MKCDVRLPYRMYVASLHFVFTLFGVSCRDNFFLGFEHFPGFPFCGDSGHGEVRI